VEPAIRSQLAQQLHPLACFTVEKGGDQGYPYLLDNFLPYAFELLKDNNVDVCTTAKTALPKLVELVKPDQMETAVLDPLFTMCEAASSDRSKGLAVEMLNILALELGERLCKDRIIPQLETLGTASSSQVRQVVAANMGCVAKAVGQDVTIDKLIPLFTALCKDDVWEVRRACTESLCDIGQTVSANCRTSSLMDLFHHLAKDTSRLVCIAAYQQLGPLIGICPKSEVTPALLKFFTDMAYNAQWAVKSGSELPEACACHFSTVAAPDRWPEMEAAYLTLVKDEQVVVRKYLANSLHEMARLLGTGITERALLEPFQRFLKDEDEVQLGVITNMTDFVEVLSPKEREKQVQSICDKLQGLENWRLRNIVASKLGTFGLLVPASVCKSTVARLCVQLLEDKVALVRSTVFSSTSVVLQHLWKGAPDDWTELLNYIKKLATSQSYQSRQMFVYIAAEIADREGDDDKLFVAEFLKPLCKLAGDGVSNVRLSVAKVVSATLINIEKYKNLDAVRQMRVTLMQDPDRDTAFFAAREVTRTQTS
jgi:serine/threonine-protein phosphatase 4 regulatory subunit 1